MRAFPVRAFTATLLVVGLTACAPEQPPAEADTTAADTDAIDTLRNDWVVAYNAADADALSNLFTEDAVSMPSGEPTSRGRAAIRDAYAKTFSMGKPSGSVMSEETQLMGDWAFDRGTFTGSLTPPDGETMTVSGRYLVVLRKQADGTWKIARDIDNSPTPTEGAAGGRP